MPKFKNIVDIDSQKLGTKKKDINGNTWILVINRNKRKWMLHKKNTDINPKVKSRISPSSSATQHKIGTIKKGNDGKMWIVVKISNGTKKWSAIKKSTAKNTKSTSGSKTSRPKSGSKTTKSTGSKTTKSTGSKSSKSTGSKSSKSSKSTGSKSSKSSKSTGSKSSKSSKSTGSKSTGSKSSRSKSSRKSPTESATIFEVGTKKQGNDGNLWVVKLSGNGIKRWVKCNSTGNTEKFSAESFFNNNKSIKLKKILSLNIPKGSIGIGEQIYNIYKVKKGYYDIYHYSGCLIAIHQSEDLQKQTFKKIKEKAMVDTGMFAVHDVSSIIHDKKTMYNKTKNVFYPYDAYDNALNHTNNSSPYVLVTKNDMDPNNPDKKTIISVFASNSEGDGYYSIFTGKNSFFIMNHKIEKKL